MMRKIFKRLSGCFLQAIHRIWGAAVLFWASLREILNEEDESESYYDYEKRLRDAVFREDYEWYD